MKTAGLSRGLLGLLLMQTCSGLPFESLDKTNREMICSHSFPLSSEVPHPIRLESDRSRPTREAEPQMKIKVFYHSSVDDLDRVKRDIVKTRVVPSAVEYWERVFKVVKGRKKILLNRKCENNQYFLSPDDPTQYCKNRCVETKCGEWTVPEEHLESCSTCDSTGRNCKKQKSEGKGVSNVDFILYVSAVATEQCIENVAGQAETVAYAAHCQQEDELDRPVAGHTNICPKSIAKPERDIQSLTSTLKHELLHALGFSSSLYAYFRDKDGQPLTPRGEDGKPPINQELQVRQWSDRTIKEVTRSWSVRGGEKERRVSLLVTPAVVREVRQHFDCPDLEGAELEDQGGDGTALTHWEKRLFQNEAMTGTVNTDNPVYSRLTLALMEDSGWYVPDYSLAQDLSWGKGRGCDFATKSCKALMEAAAKVKGGKGDTPFCSSLMQNSGERTYCTEDGRSVGSCNLVLYEEDIPAIYQNFDSLPGVEKRDLARAGSSVILADYCPYVQEFSWLGGGGAGSTEDPRGTRCESSDNEPDGEANFAMESYGPESRCFKQLGPWEQKSCTLVKQWSRYGSGCYKYSCSDGRLNIVVRNVTFACYEAGQKIPVRLLKTASDGEWLHDGSLECPACSSICSDCSREGRELKDHYEKREDLGDCLLKAEAEDPANELLGFFKSFGFNLGRRR